METIRYIPLAQLREHPEQEKIYGETEVDEEFVLSIADRGVLQPLLVAPIDGEALETDYYIIAGHRRAKGAALAGLEIVPCVAKSYNNFEFESALDLIYSNKARELTKEQKLKQIFAVKQKLCRFSQLRGNYKTLQLQKYETGLFSAIAENNEETILESGKSILDFIKKIENNSFNMAQEIAEQTGLTRGTVEKLLSVCGDESPNKFRDKIESDYPAAMKDVALTNQIFLDWEENKEAYLKGKKSLDGAYREWLEYKKDICARLDKKKSAKKAAKEAKPKPKVYISGKISGLEEILYVSRFANAERDLSAKYQTVNPVKVAKNAKTWIEAMELCIPALSECECIALLPDWDDSNGARIEKAIAESIGLKLIYL